MNLEEIKNLTTVELGTAIAEGLDRLYFLGMYRQRRIRLGNDRTYPVEFLCQKLDVIAEVEKIIGKKSLHSEYGDNLEKIAVNWLESKPNPKLRGNVSIPHWFN